jgi:hypothetical protein
MACYQDCLGEKLGIFSTITLVLMDKERARDDRWMLGRCSIFVSSQRPGVDDCRLDENRRQAGREVVRERDGHPELPGF